MSDQYLVFLNPYSRYSLESVRAVYGRRTERTEAGAGEAKEVQVEHNTGTVGAASTRDVAADASCLAVGQSRSVGYADGVVLDDGSATELASDAWNR